jgi:hypothetical protein
MQVAPAQQPLQVPELQTLPPPPPVPPKEQAPDTHTWPMDWHDSQVPPFVPHESLRLPAMQKLPLQHPAQLAGVHWAEPPPVPVFTHADCEQD